MDFEQAIRERAYLIWLAAGCELGNADAHWLAAEADILDAAMEAVGRVMAAPEKTSDDSGVTKPKPGRRVIGRIDKHKGPAQRASAPTKYAKQHAPRKVAKS